MIVRNVMDMSTICFVRTMRYVNKAVNKYFKCNHLRRVIDDNDTWYIWVRDYDTLFFIDLHTYICISIKLSYTLESLYTVDCSVK